MKTMISGAMITMALVLAGCAPSPQTETSAAASSTAAVSKDGPRKLASGDAAALSGSWSGPYVYDNGFRGTTKLKLTPTSATTVDGVFEYFWDGGNYDRYPDDGAIEGVIKADGKLHFGSWPLALARDDEKLIFTTRQQLGDAMARLKWRKTVPALPSEGTE